MSNYLIKQLETIYGVNADFWVITGADIKPVEDVEIGGVIYGYTCSGDLSLYLNANAYVAGKSMLDNCKFNVKLTEAEVDGQTRLIILQKIMESILDDESNETNLLACRAGQIGFQDAVLGTV